MCGRYYFDIDEKELKEIVEETQKNLYDEFNIGEVYPTNIAPVITKQGAVLAKWGFPKWNDNGIIINARAESLTEKKMFKELIVSNRCIVPASGFFEWKRKLGDTGFKDKYYFKNPTSILYMAGLFNTFHNKSKQISLFDTDKEQLSYVIVTKDANEHMVGVHERMPLIFTKLEMEKWLQGENLNALLSSNQVVLTHTIIS